MSSDKQMPLPTPQPDGKAVSWANASRLNGRNIRLLRISSGDDSDLICCETEVHSLDEGLPYSALSYVCGLEKAPAPIVCDNSARQATQNLQDAMWQLRHRREQDLFWIDAISINQTDLVEKTAQVAMMRDIFANAARVMVWAGPDCDEAPIAFDLLNRLYACVEEPLLEDNYGTQDLDLQKHSLPLLADPSWRALWLFLSRPFFSRVWIVQELVVYKSSITFCGDLTIGTDAVLTAPSIIRYYTNTMMACELRVSEQTRATMNNGHVTGILRSRRLGGAPLPLSDLIGLTKYHSATDERDAVFALVGIAADEPVALIDYTDSLRVCTVQSANYGHLKPKEFWVSLDMLSNVEENRTELQLPSWGPDLHLSTYGFRSLGSQFHTTYLEDRQMFWFGGDEGEVC